MTDDHQAHGVHAKSTEFAKYDQVSKKHTYHLAATGSKDEVDPTYTLTPCDMSSFFQGDDEGREAFTEQFGSSLSEIGFAILTGHGVSQSLYGQADEMTKRFFESVPLEKKLAYRAERFGSVSQGYFPIKETSNIHPDLVEGWVFCRRAFDLGESRLYKEDQFWPVEGFEPFFREYYRAHAHLKLPIMQSILRYLGANIHQYNQKLDGSNFGLRLNYYPPMTQADISSGAGRILGHEDVDMFTILPAPRIPGLQAFNQKSGKWVNIDAPPGSIVINTGDYMQLITNDLLPSTTHRVTKPEDPSLLNEVRTSCPIAIYVDEEVILEVLPELPNPKYEPVKTILFHTRSTSKFYGDDYAVEED